MYEAELIKAVQSNQAEEIVRLLGLKADPNTLGSYGWSLLASAAYSGFDTIVDILLKAGARVDQPNNYGATPLYIASQNGHVGVIDHLIKAGAKVDQPTKNGTIPLYVASQNRHLEAIDRLVKAGAKVDLPDSDGVTPLFIASYNGHVEAIDLLVKAGATVDQPNNYGRTPLYIASHEGHVDAIDHLVKAGAKVDLPDKAGRTPLLCAIRFGKREAVQRLLQAGADLTIEVAGKDALGWAKEENYPEIVALLEAEIARRKALDEKPKESPAKASEPISSQASSDSYQRILTWSKEASPAGGRALEHPGWVRALQDAIEDTLPIVVSSEKGRYLELKEDEPLESESQEAFQAELERIQKPSYQP